VSINAYFSPDGLLLESNWVRMVRDEQARAASDETSSDVINQAPVNATS
jgi:hypothetical protein